MKMFKIALFVLLIVFVKLNADDDIFIGGGYINTKEVVNNEAVYSSLVGLRVGKYFGDHRIYIDTGLSKDKDENHIGLTYNYIFQPIKDMVSFYVGGGIARVDTDTKLTLVESGVLFYLTKEVHIDTSLNFKYGTYGGLKSYLALNLLYNF